MLDYDLNEHAEFHFPQNQIAITKIIDPNAERIDICYREYYVAGPEDRSKEPVRGFGWLTKDLHELARFLRKCRIETVDMESTGVYWYHLNTVLLDYDLELVNARHVKKVPGRKSDVSDARWLQELHGLTTKKNGIIITVIPLLNQIYFCFFQKKDTISILLLLLFPSQH